MKTIQSHNSCCRSAEESLCDSNLWYDAQCGLAHLALVGVHLLFDKSMALVAQIQLQIQPRGGRV
jgi:hypothetical protein